MLRVCVRLLVELLYNRLQLHGASQRAAGIRSGPG